MSDDRMTVEEAAKYLKVGAQTIYDACKGGKLIHRRYGAGRGTIRILLADLEDYDRQCTVQAGGKKPAKRIPYFPRTLKMPR